ncbi:MAG: hypothetical protein JO029_09375 [Candidatus Eremiobacteraeota bacterium]|nr:hypothetical protein [Candidatus Eremiobacteraeota bacterium]MBV8722931.1 hypothetical protein [Candidatus Eremiobacteraeota bacterium]
MPESVKAREAVEREVRELERLCAELEKSLVGAEWEAASDAIAQSRRVTHAFLNAMESATAVRDEAFDAAVYARMRRVFDIRQDQLQRLEAFRAGVGEKLASFARWKTFARSIGAKKARAKHSVGLDSRR